MIKISEILMTFIFTSRLTFVNNSLKMINFNNYNICLNRIQPYLIRHTIAGNVGSESKLLNQEVRRQESECKNSNA